VLVGGAVCSTHGVIATGSTSVLLAEHPDGRRRQVRRHTRHGQRASAPDRSCAAASAAASIFGWSVPIHGAHSPDDDEMSAALCAVECVLNGVTTVVEAGTVAHPGGW
jgi:5-methylthioadenosine/S-adenosylhomocysteine deaminase